MQSGLFDWQKRIERVQPITSLEIEPMRWQNPVTRAAATVIHTYPRAAAAIHTYPRAAAAAIHTYTRAAAINTYPRAVATAIHIYAREAAAAAMHTYPQSSSSRRWQRGTYRRRCCSSSSSHSVEIPPKTQKTTKFQTKRNTLWKYQAQASDH